MFEERVWTPRATSGQLNAPRSYLAAVVPEVAAVDVVLRSEVRAIAAQAAAAVARLDGETAGALAPFAAILLRTEAAASSQIENVTASAKAVLMAEAGDTSRANATLVAANTATMRTAVDLAGALDSDAILAMHAALLGSSQPGWAGRWRDEQVWIGGRASSPHQATFVPPHHSRVPAAIDDLVAFMARTDLAAFEQALIGHAQFETIHPFPDGNGRTGRALIHAALRNAGLTSAVTVPISAGLLGDTRLYFDALMTYRAGDPNPIVELAADATFRAVANGRELVAEIAAHQARWRSLLVGIRSDALARRVVDMLVRQPVVDAAAIQAQFAVSFPTATTALKQLSDLGVLQRANAGLRFRKWVAGDIADALDRFAGRAGRRQ